MGLVGLRLSCVLLIGRLVVFEAAAITEGGVEEGIFPISTAAAAAAAATDEATSRFLWGACACCLDSFLGCLFLLSSDSEEAERE